VAFKGCSIGDAKVSVKMGVYSKAIYVKLYRVYVYVYVCVRICVYVHAYVCMCMCVKCQGR
jgi:hypothetical protein